MESERDLFAFSPLAKIMVATSFCGGGSNLPPADCDLTIQIPLKPKNHHTQRVW